VVPTLSHKPRKDGAPGEGERDLTLRLHQHQRKQDYVQRFHQTIQPARHSWKLMEQPATDQTSPENLKI
jgi:hypothetical protein